jgi:hypothetical protein
LNENVARQYGYKLKLESFSLDQLKAARDSLSADIANFERSNKFDAVYEDVSYQKNRALLDVLTQAITERTMTKGEEQKKEKYVKGMKKVKGDFEKRYGKDNAKSVMYATASKMAKESTVDGAMNILRETLLQEATAEATASLIMASRDMIDKVTDWLEACGGVKTDTMLQLTDAIRDEMGMQTSQQFADSVKPALDEIYDCLERNRQVLTGALGIITGDETPMPADQSMEEPEEPSSDSFAGSAPAAGGNIEAGRMKRESYNRNSKKKV